MISGEQQPWGGHLSLGQPASSPRAQVKRPLCTVLGQDPGPPRHTGASPFSDSRVSERPDFPLPHQPSSLARLLFPYASSSWSSNFLALFV